MSTPVNRSIIGSVSPSNLSYALNLQRLGLHQAALQVRELPTFLSLWQYILRLGLASLLDNRLLQATLRDWPVKDQ